MEREGESERKGERGREREEEREREGEESYLNGSFNVMLVYSHSHPHKHVLWTLHHLPIDLEQVRPLQSLRGEGEEGGGEGRQDNEHPAKLARLELRVWLWDSVV